MINTSVRQFRFIRPPNNYGAVALYKDRGKQEWLFKRITGPLSFKEAEWEAIEFTRLQNEAIKHWWMPYSPKCYIDIKNERGWR